MQIRRATAADAAGIASLIRSLSASFLVSPDGKGAEPFFFSISEQSIRGYIASPDFSYFVAEADEKLAGLVALRDNTHLYHLFVAEACQGKGLGRQLWMLIRETALQRGNAGKFTVNASLQAVSFYERFGFLPSGAVVEKHGITFLPMQLVIDEGASSAPAQAQRP